MKTFKEFINEGIEIQNSVDFINIMGFGKKINSDTVKINHKDVNKVIQKLIKFGYSKLTQDKNTIIYKTGSHGVGISSDEYEMYDTIVIW